MAMQHFMKIIFQFLCFFCSYGLFCTTLFSQTYPPSNPHTLSVTDHNALLQWDDHPQTASWLVTLTLQHSTETEYFHCDSNHISLNNLLPHATYFWKVCSISENNDTSAYTPLQWFQTETAHQGTFRCPAPCGLSIMNISDENATIQWIPTHAFDTLWELVYGPVSNNTIATGTALSITNTTFQTLHHIAPHTYHQASIRNVCPDTVSEWTTIFFNNSYQLPRVLPVLCDFETPSDIEHFSFISGSDNPWVIDSAENYTFAGNQGLYVSVDNGEHALYSRKRAALSYAYTDIDIPYDAESFYLDFRWKGAAQSDTLQIFLLPRNAELDIMNAPGENYRIGTVTYAHSNNRWQNERIELDSLFVGYEKKLVFMWHNKAFSDTTGIAPAIDELYITARYCSRPGAPIISNITAENAIVSWGSVPDQQHFNIQYRKDSDTEWTTRNQTISGHVLDSLQDGITYHVRIQTVCTTSEESLWSDVVSFTTNVRCLPPSQPQASNITSTQMNIAWQDSVSIRWVLQYRESGSSTPFICDTVNHPTDTLHNLQPNTTYEIIVRGICASMDLSYPSPTLFATTACPPHSSLPWTAFNDTLTLTTSSSPADIPNCWSLQGNELISPILDLSLAGNLNLSYSYIIQSPDATPSSGTWLKVSKDNGNTWQNLDVLTITETFSSRNFDFSAYAGFPNVRIKVEFFLDQHASIKLHNLKIEERCLPPTEISTIYLTDSSATFDWVPAANQTAWILLYKKQNETGLQPIYVTELPYTLEYLSPETCYDYQVCATCNHNLSDTSALLHFCTPATPIGNTCLPPNEIQVAVIYASDNKTNISFSWNPIDNQHLWQIEYKDSMEYFSHFEEVSFSTHFTLRNVNLYRTYLFRIRSVCNTSDTSEWSSWHSIVAYPNGLDELASGIECKVYPNPAKDELFLNIHGATLRNISVYNLYGVLVASFSPSSPLNLSALPPQTYYLSIETDKGILHRKIVLRK